MKAESKIYVAGHRGLVGSGLVRMLQRKGHRNLVLRSHTELELTDRRAVEQFFRDAGYTSVSSGPWQIPHEPNHWPMRSVPIFRYLPASVKRYLTRFGYGLIVTATK